MAEDINKRVNARSVSPRTGDISDILFHNIANGFPAAQLYTMENFTEGNDFVISERLLKAFHTAIDFEKKSSKNQFRKDVWTVNQRTLWQRPQGMKNQSSLN